MFTSCSRRHSVDPESVEPLQLARNDANSANPRNGYVDDSTCAECHQAISETYRGHSMGRSLASPETAEVVERFAADGTATFEADGFRYEVEHDDGRTIHRQRRIGLNNQLVAEVSQPIAFAVGSGHHGRSYLVNRDGYLFLSPITWYPQKGIWDLSPGFEKNNSQFHRPVPETCLFCHANRALHNRDRVNHYESPILDGHAIGCQRCHGPAEDHVARHRGGEAVELPDATIVNPGRLEPRLREAVCAQCHLSGVARVVRRGKTLDDFRPGMPLESCLSVFVLSTVTTEKEEFVGQVEQMQDSRCYQGSDGQLGCISCHDPHFLPTQPERAAYYRDRCLQCHQVQTCSMPKEQRDRESGDNCIDCHMPRQETEIRHAATSNHRIVRHRNQQVSSTQAATNRGMPLVQFPPNSKLGPDAEQRRDLAIAVVRAIESHPERIRLRHVEAACATLESAVRRAPDDVEALEALARARWKLGDLRGALEPLAEVLRSRPRREFSVVTAADLLTSLGQPEQAAHNWQQAVELNPWMARYWYSLANAHAELNNWSRCQQVALEAAKRFPTSIGAKYLLVRSHLELGDRQAAEEAFRSIEQFNPNELPQLREWLEQYPTNRK